jgi:hypothetical protein
MDRQYTVSWSYDCCVGSAEEAARLASEVMRSGNDHGGHTVLEVECEDGTACDVDLAKIDAPVSPTPSDDDYRMAARDRQEDGVVEFDADAPVSRTEAGAYVQAWVFVPKAEVTK